MPGFTVAVIGCGSIAQNLHLPGYARRSDVGRIVGADPEPARLKEVSDKFAMAAVYPDYRSMLKAEKPDFLSVCSPNVFHAEHAVAALESGATVLLEKPMALTREEAMAVKAASERTGRPVMVGFSHRMYQGNRKIKEILNKGGIGEPFMIRSRFAHGGPFPGWAKSAWFYDPKMAGGGALLDMGIHAIDLCQWLIGPIKSVSAVMGTLRKDISVDDNAVLALEFGGRALGYIEVGWTSGPGFNGLEIYGDKGTIVNDYQTLRLCTGKSSPDHDAKPDFSWETVDEAPSTGGWPVEVDYFMDTALSGREFGCDLDAGISSLSVALAAVESAVSGRKVSLEGNK